MVLLLEKAAQSKKKKRKFQKVLWFKLLIMNSIKTSRHIST